MEEVDDFFLGIFAREIDPHARFGFGDNGVAQGLPGFGSGKFAGTFVTSQPADFRLHFDLGRIGLDFDDVFVDARFGQRNDDAFAVAANVEIGVFDIVEVDEVLGAIALGANGRDGVAEVEAVEENFGTGAGDFDGDIGAEDDEFGFLAEAADAGLDDGGCGVTRREGFGGAVDETVRGIERGGEDDEQNDRPAPENPN